MIIREITKTNKFVRNHNFRSLTEFIIFVRQQSVRSKTVLLFDKDYGANDEMDLRMILKEE